MKVAVAVLFETVNGKYVMVSRKDDSNAFGLPGGKVEEGETLVNAAVREIREEIGFLINPDKLHGLLNRKDGDYEVLTFYYDDPVDIKNLYTKEAGVIAEGRDELLTGPFGEYNEVVLQKYERLKNG